MAKALVVVGLVLTAIGAVILTLLGTVTPGAVMVASGAANATSQVQCMVRATRLGPRV